MNGITEDKPKEREFGTQPLDAKMNELGFANHALVAVSTEQLTHKMVSKARSGHFLSVRVRLKVLHAFNKAANTELRLSDLFNY